MRLNKILLVVLAGVSLFIGFVIFSVAAGAVFPSLHKLTAPLICRGDVQVESLKYSYKPGQVGWENHIYCTANGVQKEITLPAIGVTGLLASALIFVVLVFQMRKSITLPGNFGELATDLKPENKKKGSALERMSELKKMRDENLITDAEYQMKKANIMKEL
jgi:hypothetical protein